MSRKRFEIYYPADHHDPERRGTKYKPESKTQMVVMNSQGIFFLYDGEPFYPSIKRLSSALPQYDVRWR